MRLPKLWRKKRGGKFIGNWYVTVAGDDVNLGTKDAELARKHLREAMKGRRDFVDEVDAAAAAMSDIVEEPPPPAPAAAPAAPPAAAPAAPPAPAPAAPAAPPALLPIPAENTPPAPDPEEFADTAAAAAEAAGAGDPDGGGAEQGRDPQAADITNEQLATIGVDAQVWVSAWYARRKVYKGFIPPPTPKEARAPLEVEWKKILDYANVGAHMPPWVTGLLIPGVTLVSCTVAMAGAFAMIAEEQRKAAGAPSQQETPGAAVQ